MAEIIEANDFNFFSINYFLSDSGFDDFFSSCLDVDANIDPDVNLLGF